VAVSWGTKKRERPHRANWKEKRRELLSRIVRNTNEKRRPQAVEGEQADPVHSIRAQKASGVLRLGEKSRIKCHGRPLGQVTNTS